MLTVFLVDGRQIEFNAGVKLEDKNRAGERGFAVQDNDGKDLAWFVVNQVLGYTADAAWSFKPR